jgi:PadR family transcriptional regulator, regulatory protein PadR
LLSFGFKVTEEGFSQISATRNDQLFHTGGLEVQTAFNTGHNSPGTYLLLSQRKHGTLLLETKMAVPVKQKADVLQGTLALMVLKTLDVLGTLHGYGIARRIEQISGNLLAVNQGTLYPVLLKLEQEGAIASDWGTSENNRRARFYRLTRDGRKQLQAETQDWEQTAAIIGRFFEAKAEDLP